jgi:hypothetical protein
MINGEWLGSIMPPDPTRIFCVPAAICPIKNDVAELAIPGNLNVREKVITIWSYFMSLRSISKARG